MQAQTISFSDDGRVVSDASLPDVIFGVEVNPLLIARAVNWQLAKRRSGCHKVKTRSEVSATTAKPYKQKGTGRARQGSKVSTQMRGGGIVFGPLVRSHAVDMPKKQRKLALAMALSQKHLEGKVFLSSEASASEISTSKLSARLQGNNLSSALIADGSDLNQNFALSSRNLPFVDYISVKGINVYDILRHDNLVLTDSALQYLKEFFGHECK